MTNHYQAILFDFDGVLVDSEPIHWECWREVLAPWNFDLDWPTYSANCIGISDRLMIQEFCKAVQPALSFDELWATYPLKTEIFRKKMETRDVFHPETLALIRSLRDYKLAVVSSSGRTEVEPPLVRAGIRDHFGALVCGREVPNLKPAPDPYRRAAELLGVEHALVVEDSEAGETSGRAAGFDVLRLSNPEELPSRLRAVLNGSAISSQR